jgi:5-methylcytosine-specific restriction endonuclease McrA
VSPYIPAFLERQVRSRAREICEYCLLPQDSQEATFHIDHVVPRAAGGETEIDNLALACVTCSLCKSAKQSATDPETQQTVPLFNPRADNWREHFRVTDEFLIEGITSNGRASIAALRMNRSLIVSIRKEIGFLGRFPPAQE